MRYLHNEHDNLMTYFKRIYIDYLVYKFKYKFVHLWTNRYLCPRKSITRAMNRVIQFFSYEQCYQHYTKRIMNIRQAKNVLMKR